MRLWIKQMSLRKLCSCNCCKDRQLTSVFFLFCFFCHGFNQHNTGDIFIPGVHWGSHASTVALGLDPEKLLKFLFPPRTPKTCSDRPWTWLCWLIICVPIFFIFFIDFNFITCRWWKIGIFYDSLKSKWVHSLVYLLFATHFSDVFAWHCRCSSPALRSDHFPTVFWEMLIADSTSVHSSLNLLPAIYKRIIVAVMSCLVLNDSKRVLYKLFYVWIWMGKRNDRQKYPAAHKWGSSIL